MTLDESKKRGSYRARHCQLDRSQPPMTDAPAPGAAIPMKCTKCGRTKKLARRDAPDIPTCVVTMTCTPCPACDNGDFGMEEWFDANGKSIDPEDFKPFDLKGTP